MEIEIIINKKREEKIKEMEDFLNVEERKIIQVLIE